MRLRRRLPKYGQDRRRTVVMRLAMPGRATLRVEAARSVGLCRRGSRPSSTSRAVPPACAAGSASSRKYRNSLSRVPKYDSWASCEHTVQSEGQSGGKLNVQVQCHKLLISHATASAKVRSLPLLRMVVAAQFCVNVEKSRTQSSRVPVGRVAKPAARLPTGLCERKLAQVTVTVLFSWSDPRFRFQGALVRGVFLLRGFA
jgi:hypothetical protein